MIPLDKQNELIEFVCDDLKAFLMQKNTDYNGAALNPSGTFSKVSAKDTIAVRIDDKLARLASPHAKTFEEDTMKDLMGYFVLLRCALIIEGYESQGNRVAQQLQNTTFGINTTGLVMSPMPPPEEPPAGAASAVDPKPTTPAGDAAQEAPKANVF